MKPITLALMVGAGAMLLAPRRGKGAPSGKGPRSPQAGPPSPALSRYYQMRANDRLNAPPIPNSEAFRDSIYPPRESKTVELFTEAARQLGYPLEWGQVGSGLHYVLDRESDGYVGLPNSASRHRGEWPQIWAAAVSAARGSDYSVEANPYGTEYIGLGQVGVSLSRSAGGWPGWEGWSAENLPRGPKSLGVPLEEAVGMLRYIEGKYGTPDHAKRWYQSPEYPGCDSVRHPDNPARWVYEDSLDTWGTSQHAAAGHPPLGRHGDTCSEYKAYLRRTYPGQPMNQAAVLAGYKFHDGY